MSGISTAIEHVYPEAEIQKCIVHQIRNSLQYVGWKEQKAEAQDLKAVYTAPTEEAGLETLKHVEEVWGQKFPYIVKSWEQN